VWFKEALVRASERYFGVLQDIADMRSAPVASEKAAAVTKPKTRSGDRYRVRVKLLGSPRSRYLTVVAHSEREAEQRALQKAGKGWSLLDSPVREPSAAS
jgi:hypothetical protein